ncbi:MAG: adenylyl-sulfate kinase [Candidatus Bathyarchaeia archaeon]
MRKYRSGWAVWITGLPGSGKSTIARLLAKKLANKGILTQILSSDMLRRSLTPRLGYTEKERDQVYSALIFTAKLLTQNGINVIIDATGNRRRYRDKARKEIGNFLEAYLKCPLELCIEREKRRRKLLGAPRGIYKKGLNKLSSTVPGLGAPYEHPLNPEVTVNTDQLSCKDSANKILEAVVSKFGLE